MISQELPTYEKINNLEDFALLYSEPTRTKVAEFISAHSELIRLNSLKENDKEAYFETIKSITDLISEDYFSGKELENLMQSLEFIPEESVDEVARWNNDFTIVINKKLFKRNKSGGFVYNISHDIYHEIGHSIIELADDEHIEIPYEVYDILEETDIKYESQYIQECVVNNLDPNVIKKERMAEIFGFFLTSHKNKEEFCLKKILAMADKELVSLLELKDTSFSDLEKKAKSNIILSGLLANTLRLYDILSSSWVKIRGDIGALDISQHLEAKNEQAEVNELKNVETIETPNPTQQLAPEALKTDITDKSTHNLNRGFSESAGLGKNPERSQGFISLMGQLIKDFSEQVPNV